MGLIPELVGHTAPLLVPLGGTSIRDHHGKRLSRARCADFTRVVRTGGFARRGEEVASTAPGTAVAVEDGGAAGGGGDHGVVARGGVAVLPGAGAAAGAGGGALEGSVLLRGR